MFRYTEIFKNTSLYHSMAAEVYFERATIVQVAKPESEGRQLIVVTIIK
jgi:hypothetical protein